MNKSSETVSSSKKKSSKGNSTKFKFLAITNMHTLKKSEIYNYITRLHKMLKKAHKKIKKYREKLKKKKRSKKKEGETSIDKSEVMSAEMKSNTEVPEGNQTKSDALASDAVNPSFAFVDEMKKAAAIADRMAGFVYEPTSGLYYDRGTGYYYNSEYDLFYDGNTGCYYKYNEEDRKYDFHSQVYAEEPPVTKCDTKQVYKNTSSIDSLMQQFSHLDIDQCRLNALDVARKYPPSLRIVVLETNLPKLKVGELFLITYKGGTLGREGALDVIIPDINVSKYHLKFTYNDSKSQYDCIDLGSRNGTLLNGKRMSNAKQESEPIAIFHGANIQLSQTKLLVHMHDGHTTCGHCEPGLLGQTDQVNPQITEEQATLLTHKQELKKLKKRYGLADEKYLIQKCTMANDRAAQRRKEVGSSTQYEKTDVASTLTNIPVNNAGFKMLSKLGWSPGQKLGKNDAGLLEPVGLVSNKGQKGLGYDEVIPSSVINKSAKQQEQLRITQERYNQALSLIHI